MKVQLNTLKAVAYRGVPVPADYLANAGCYSITPTLLWPYTRNERAEIFRAMLEYHRQSWYTKANERTMRIGTYLTATKEPRDRAKGIAGFLRCNSNDFTCRCQSIL